MGFVPFPSTIQNDIIPVVRSCPKNFPAFTANPSDTSQLPFWALISFGAYLLFKLGWGVLTFNDVPEAYAELMKQIEQARVELKRKGVEVD